MWLSGNLPIGLHSLLTLSVMSIKEKFKVLQSAGLSL